MNIIIVETKQNSNKQLQADAMINLCRNYDLIKDYNNSIKVALEGFHFSEKHKLSYNQLRFADHLQYMYAQTNDYEKAHKFLTIRLNLTEDYYHKLYNEKFLEYEEKFQMNEKQKIINQKEKILKQKDDELARQNLIKYVILIGLTIVLIFLIILIYYIRIIKNKNKELTFISDQNEFLVAETHHRINNNLQLITILVENELDKVLVTDEVSKKNILVKIDSLQLLHRQLYRNKDKKDLNLKDFLQDIRKNMGILMYDNNVDVHFEIEELVIPINQAMYIGLLVTELCINSLKHAFNGQSDKKIKLVITKIDGKIIFNYSDNSKKTDELPKLVLVDKLCRQLRVDCTSSN
ncbi:sensor histidine kinase [Flavobacterium sp. I3-2]|uniref:sensor histidine kinase n=1 Tax=Flavobacterium sp. I3-2 TaxID=2748319 RepID=UPI0015A82994|nr:sensor histidine kinase [Flavobacterium sp. I3-2]